MKKKATVRVKAKCLQDGCGKPVYCRGLCQSCYKTMARLVDLDRASWQDAIAKGQALEDGRKNNGSKFRSALGKALSKSPSA